MAQTEQAWGSRLGLILAMAGSAVGLGNFLRFPVQAVQNGGGAFIIPYLVSFILLGLPLVMIEWSTGKFGGRFGRHSPPTILQSLNKSKFWRYAGSLGLFSSIIICAYYCYIESWILSYALHSVFGTFDGMTETEVSSFFNTYLDLGTSTSGIPYDTFLCFAFCLFLNIFILSHGIAKGIERVAKFCMPLLLIFGLFLVYKAYTMHAGEHGALFDSTVALNFLWTPDFDSLLNPKVWLSAAGQVFFTLSLGMGAIQTYASYLKEKDDVALSSMTAAFTNEFTEIVIGSAIIIPISIGYFGIDKVVELTKFGGLGLGFRTMPYLFEQWGDVLSALAGFSFFGLLFFAAITSSLSIAQPFVAFLSNNYDWSQRRTSYFFGIVLFVMALPCVLFFDKGVFDQYDFWGGTIALFFFAMLEAIAFSWVMGVNKGWELINSNGDIQMPKFYKFVLRYITPTMLIIIFIAALIKPKDDDWSLLSLKGWELDDSSIIGELRHQSIGPNKTWFADEFYAENEGVVKELTADAIVVESQSYSLPKNVEVLVSVDETVSLGTPLYKGHIVNTVFYIDACRIGLVLFIGLLCLLIYKAKSHNFEETKEE
ncbi:MAG: sodium-dependent transporter [Bacteroidales bacterium]|nr:sodium-dependent transporter [Bacteroidales bacterium]